MRRRRDDLSLSMFRGRARPLMVPAVGSFRWRYRGIIEPAA